MKVLLIDDHPLILSALQTVIEAWATTSRCLAWTAPHRHVPR